MKIATFNVNSINARLGNLTAWLEAVGPDIVLLQEIKCQTEAFPALAFEALGYRARASGQKSYNGVAILSRDPIEDVQEGLPGDLEDTQARYLEATIKGVRVAAIYLPNGNPIATPKFDYKLAWMSRLHRRAAELLATGMPIVLGGDYNVIPEPADCENPAEWQNDALFQPESRRAFRALLHLGYYDAFRSLHPDARRAYTFWDYQKGALQRDDGIRIDHLLLSPQALDRLVSCSIDKQPRLEPKASDHTPIMLELHL